MKTIKVKFVDYWNNHHLEEDIIYKWLNAHYNVIFCDDPDYIFYSCFGQEHLKYDCIRIFYTAENIAPDFNECDYALSFEKIDFSDRNIQLPNLFKYKKEIDLINSASFTEPDETLLNRKFCSYVVSNGNGDNIRNLILDKLSEYKQVDSGGKFRNNVGGPVEDKLKFQNEYKFSIAFENSSHAGYTTEKILQSFASRTVPIYWGDPRVTDYFNSDAFINIMDFDSLEDAISYIKEIDADDEKYLKIVRNNPWSCIDLYERKMDEFDRFMSNIFEQQYQQAFRRNKSAMVAQKERNIILWKEFYIKNHKSNMSIKEKIEKLIGRIKAIL